MTDIPRHVITAQVRMYQEFTFCASDEESIEAEVKALVDSGSAAKDGWKLYDCTWARRNILPS